MVTSYLFSILSSPDDDVLELRPWPNGVVTEPMWAELADQLARQQAIMPCTAAMLARRFEEGYSAAVVWQGQIVSHLAVVPIGCRAGGPGAPHAWAGFCAAAGIEATHLPSVDAYEIVTGWTAPAWRGKRISNLLRQPLLARYAGDHSLVLGGMIGMASPVLARLGWQVLGWSATPFVSSLIAVPLADLRACAPSGWHIPADLARYEGPLCDLDDFLRASSQYCYFSVSSLALAHQLDSELAELCQDDLCRWRLAVLDVLSQPESLHQLALLPGKDGRS